MDVVYEIDLPLVFQCFPFESEYTCIVLSENDDTYLRCSTSEVSLLLLEPPIPFYRANCIEPKVGHQTSKGNYFHVNWTSREEMI